MKSAISEERADEPPASFTMPAAILVIEDDLVTRRLLQEVLERDGCFVVTAGSVAEAMAEVGRREFDLVLLDLILPDGDGLSVCRRIRERHQMPIVICSTRKELDDRLAGFDHGADDYIVKPFEPREVVARVRAHVRRARDASAPEEVIYLGRVVVDGALQDAIVDGRPAGLTRKEFQLLHLLASRRGRAVSRELLIDQLWAEDELASDKNVAVYVRRLRSKIERDPDNPEIILTVRGFGYRAGAAR
jgi:DNA-binding response OmpR family regulator